MTNPHYQVHITYQPSYPSGVQGVYGTSTVNGLTYSALTSQSIIYGGGWFVASMPEIKISATGSSYTSALSNLMIIATASSTLDNGLPAISEEK